MIPTAIVICCYLVSKENLTLPLKQSLPHLSNSHEGLLASILAGPVCSHLRRSKWWQSVQREWWCCWSQYSGTGSCYHCRVMLWHWLRARAGQQSPPYQLHNDFPWVIEAMNALISQDPKALSDIRQDCTTILVTILKEAKVPDILLVELEVPSNKSLYTVWKLALE